MLNPNKLTGTSVLIDDHWYSIKQAIDLLRGRYAAARAAGDEDKMKEIAKMGSAVKRCDVAMSHEIDVDDDRHLVQIHPDSGWQTAQEALQSLRVSWSYTTSKITKQWILEYAQCVRSIAAEWGENV